MEAKKVIRKIFESGVASPVETLSLEQEKKMSQGEEKEKPDIRQVINDLLAQCLEAGMNLSNAANEILEVLEEHGIVEVKEEEELPEIPEEEEKKEEEETGGGLEALFGGGEEEEAGEEEEERTEEETHESFQGSYTSEAIRLIEEIIGGF